MGWGMGEPLRRLGRHFWTWYERHYALNVAIAAGLFVLQLVHLYWLSADVVAFRLTGERYLGLGGPLRYLIVVVDYTEIPALISTTLLYVNDLRKRFSWRSVLFLLFLNSQWLHLFWITDEFVVGEFTREPGSSLPAWLAWTAIGIDYLELPVIVDVVRKLVAAIRRQRVSMFLRKEVR